MLKIVKTSVLPCFVMMLRGPRRRRSWPQQWSGIRFRSHPAPAMHRVRDAFHPPELFGRADPQQPRLS